MHVISNRICVDQSPCFFSKLVNHCLFIPNIDQPLSSVPIHVNHGQCFTILVEHVLVKQNVFEGPLKSKVAEDSFCIPKLFHQCPSFNNFGKARSFHTQNWVKNVFFLHVFSRQASLHTKILRTAVFSPRKFHNQYCLVTISSYTKLVNPCLIVATSGQTRSFHQQKWSAMTFLSLI